MAAFYAVYPAGISALPAGAATSANQTTEIAAINAFSAKTASALVPEPYDYQLISYVTVGNGIGEIQTVTYKLGGSSGTLVAVLTMTYDASNRLASVTRS